MRQRRPPYLLIIFATILLGFALYDIFQMSLTGGDNSIHFSLLTSKPGSEPSYDDVMEQSTPPAPAPATDNGLQRSAEPALNTQPEGDGSQRSAEERPTLEPAVTLLYPDWAITETPTPEPTRIKPTADPQNERSRRPTATPGAPDNDA